MVSTIIEYNVVFYKKAFDIARAMEMASKDIQDLLRPVTYQSDYSKITVPKDLNFPVTDGCHPSHTCRLPFGKCHLCGKKGHILKVKVCISKPQHVKRQFTRPIKQTQ